MGRRKIKGYTVENGGVACAINYGLHALGVLVPCCDGESPHLFEIHRAAGKAPTESCRQRVIRTILRTSRIYSALRRSNLIQDLPAVKSVTSFNGEWRIVRVK